METPNTVDTQNPSPETKTTQAVRLHFSLPSSGSSFTLNEGHLLLLNTLLALKNGALLTLRVTDLSDPDPTSAQARLESILADVDWLQIPHQSTLYKQSEQVGRYQSLIDALLAEKKAYPCFCTPERLEAERRRFIAKGTVYRYEGDCRNLSEEKKADFVAKGASPIIRLRVDRQIIKFEDQMHGEQITDSEEIGDWILRHASGQFTRDFVNAIDLHQLGVTHVLRTEDELQNVPRELLVYQACGQASGWIPPQYTHIPLLLDENKKLLSPKKGGTTLADLRKEGYLPQSYVNYVGLLGWAFVDIRKAMPLEEMAKRFRTKDLQKNSSTFEWEKLKHFNAFYLQHESIQVLGEQVKNYLPQYSKIVQQRGEGFIDAQLPLLQKEVKTLKEMGELLELFLVWPIALDKDVQKAISSRDGVQTLKLIVQELETIESLSPESVQILMEGVKAKMKSNFKNPYSPLRIALTGHSQGSDLTTILVVLGKDECVKRINYVISHLQHRPSK